MCVWGWGGYKLSVQGAWVTLLFPDASAGTVERAPSWRERFKCLNKSNSCHRHITRMLKCLGELNHENLKVGPVNLSLNYTSASDSLLVGSICGVHSPGSHHQGNAAQHARQLHGVLGGGPQVEMQ